MSFRHALATGMLVALFPLTVSALTTEDIYAQTFSLFNRIISLQTQLIQSLDAAVADLKSKLSSANNELSTTKVVLSSVNSQLLESQKQLSTANTSLASAQADLATTKTQLKSTQDELAICKSPPPPPPTPPATTAGCMQMTGAQTTSGQNYCGDLICPNNPPSYRYWCSGGSLAVQPHWSSTSCSGMFCLTRSDIRLKENVAPIQDVLVKLLQLNGIFFNWKNSSVPQERQMGVIAQEVQKVFPEAVIESNGVLYVNYHSLIAPIIEALKELKLQNDALRREIETAD